MDENTQKIISTIDGVLSVIKTIADTPGINMLPYVNTVSGAIGLAQVALDAGQDVLPIFDKLRETFGDGAKVPTLEELAALDADIAAMHARIQSPPPAAEEGEPD